MSPSKPVWKGEDMVICDRDCVYLQVRIEVEVESNIQVQVEVGQDKEYMTKFFSILQKENI